MTEMNEYLNNDIDPFSKETTIENAVAFFDEFRYSYFPVVDNGVYVGSISNDDASFLDTDKTIGDFLYVLKGFLGQKTDNVVSLLELFAKNQTTVLPVLDQEKKYAGYYEIEDVIQLFSDFPFLSGYGGTLIVGKDIDNFSMGQIAQIVESNGVQILGLLVSKFEDEKVEVTVKLNTDVTDGLIQTFRRYGYEIINALDEDSYLKKLKERAAYLSKYMDI